MAQTQARNGKFSKPTTFFSQISNDVLRDPALSLRAKGLYALIVSYITLPDFILYKSFLQNQCLEGRCAFNSAWKELVEAGILHHKRIRQEDGTFSYEYTLHSPTVSKTSSPSKKEKIEKNPSAPSTEPQAENQPPVSYIENKTLNTKTQSYQKNVNELREQIDYNYFLENVAYEHSDLMIIDTVLTYLAELKYKNAISSTMTSDVIPFNFIDTIDTCIFQDFLAYVQKIDFTSVRSPVPYLQKTFLNFIQASYLSVAVL